MILNIETKTLGIDATNLRHGGGRTHLIELLRAANPKKHGFGKVVIWGAESTLALLEDRKWLIKRSPAAQNKGLLQRSIWQKYRLSIAAQSEGCDLLFVPGGSFNTDFRPIVTMSRNMLPFEWHELKRFGFSPITLRLLLLRFLQGRSYQQADGVIFLTRYAKTKVQSVVGEFRGRTSIIPHGLSSRFNRKPKPQPQITDCSADRPYRVLYVSIVNRYKHQWNVVEALSALRKHTGWSIALDLVGNANSSALLHLKRTISNEDPNNDWVSYHGPIPYEKLHLVYEKADLGIFASSCENMPNILLEMMAAGLPLASSDRGPMPEILNNGGVYFDPEDPSSIERSLKSLISDPALRSTLADSSFSESFNYTWDRCADETFAFLSQIGQKFKESTTSREL